MNKSTLLILNDKTKYSLTLLYFPPCIYMRSFIHEDKWRVTVADNLKTMTTSFFNFLS